MTADLLSDIETTDSTSNRREEDLDQTKSPIQRLVYSCPVDHSGTSVYVKGWYQPDLIATPILFVHDVGEHFGLYRDAATSICSRGHNVYGFDLRGHGRSGRRAGHIQKFSLLIKDLLQVCAWVRNREKGRAPIIVGQGFGALIALSFQKYYLKHCAGIVLAAPSISLLREPNRFRAWVIRILSESSPTMRLPKSLRPRITDVQTHSIPDKEIGGEHVDVTDKITARYAHEVLQAIERSTNLLRSINGDTLILCPEADTLCRYDSVLQTVASLEVRSKVQIDMISDAGHQLFSGPETGRNAAIDHLIQWIERKRDI